MIVLCIFYSEHSFYKDILLYGDEAIRVRGVIGLRGLGPRSLWALAGRGEGVSPSLNPTPRAAYWWQGEGPPSSTSATLHT